MNVNKKTKDEKDEKEQTWFKMFCWIVPNLKIALNFFLHSPQKKTKQLEGETIYIRHSNLMLEVCMNISSPFQLSDPFVFAFMSACMLNFFWRHCIYFFFLLLTVYPHFQLNSNAWACTLFLSNSHASKITLLCHCLDHILPFCLFVPLCVFVCSM